MELATATSDADADATLAELAGRGEVIAAVRFARRAKRLSLTEARALVNDLATGAPPPP